MSHSISPVDKSPSGECVAVAKEETVDQEIHPMSREEEDAPVHDGSLREFKRMSLMQQFRFQTTTRRMRKKLGSPVGCEIQDNRLRR